MYTVYPQCRITLHHDEILRYNETHVIDELGQINPNPDFHSTSDSKDFNGPTSYDFQNFPSQAQLAILAPRFMAHKLWPWFFRMVMQIVVVWKFFSSTLQNLWTRRHFLNPLKRALKSYPGFFITSIDTNNQYNSCLHL